VALRGAAGDYRRLNLATVATMPLWYPAPDTQRDVFNGKGSEANLRALRGLADDPDDSRRDARFLF
jgi:hypothetical protein